MTGPRENPLHRLPIEIQRLILVSLLSSIKVTPVRGGAIIADEESNLRNTSLFTFQDTEGNDFESDTIPLYKLPPQEIDNLNLYRSIFSPEAREPWESHVQFSFPSTLAMLDILLGPDFTPERRKLVKRVKYVAYPVPLYGDDPGCYTTHFPGEFFYWMTGLELDALEHKDVYIENDDGFGKMGFTCDAETMMAAPGWKTLEVLADWVKLQDGNRHKLESAAAEIRNERSEPDFSYDLEAVGGAEVGEGSGQGDGQGEEVDGTDSDGSNTDESPGAEGHVRISVRRGRGANVAPEGVGDSKVLKYLFAKWTWEQVRLDGRYLVDEGIDDPCAHL
ncbi:hypothetical protein ACJ41O_001608 [Fusarium nematophilum]